MYVYIYTHKHAQKEGERGMREKGREMCERDRGRAGRERETVVHHINKSYFSSFMCFFIMHTSHFRTTGFSVLSRPSFIAAHASHIENLLFWWMAR